MSAPSLSLFLAGQLRKLRHRHGLTQERAAALIGCDYKYYQAMEAGTKDLRLSMIERLAPPFGLQPQQLFLQKLPATHPATAKGRSCAPSQAAKNAS